MALELNISTEKYQAQISMLQSNLALLRNLETEYEALQSQVPSFAGSSDAVTKMQQNVHQNVQLVEKSIQSCEAAIRTLEANVATMENVGSSIESIIDDSMNIASALL